MDVKIRAATIDDADSIAAFQVAMALETENKTLDNDIVLTATKQVFKDPEKGFYLVADVGGKPVGSLMITYEWSDWRNSNLWWIQSVFVTPEFRRQGIFQRMYAHIMEEARKNDVMFVRLYVETENAGAQKVYESLGMKRMPYFMYDIKPAEWISPAESGAKVEK